MVTGFFQMMYGFPGCMPESYGYYSWYNFDKMKSGIEEIIEFYDFDEKTIEQIDLASAWEEIQSGRDVYMVFRDKGTIIEFSSISEQEYEKMLERDDLY